MPKVDMTGIVAAVNKRNAESPKIDAGAIEAITKDDNTVKTPIDNANDIDTLAIAILMIEKLVDNLAGRMVEIERQHATLVSMIQSETPETPEVPEAPVV